jgi:hypothetical protein
MTVRDVGFIDPDLLDPAAMLRSVESDGGRGNTGQGHSQERGDVNDWEASLFGSVGQYRLFSLYSLKVDSGATSGGDAGALVRWGLAGRRDNEGARVWMLSNVIVKEVAGDHIGAKIWDAAMLLSEYVGTVLGPDYFLRPQACTQENAEGALCRLHGTQSKTVIELGAGCGVAGLVAHAMGGQVTLTDLPHLIPLLDFNVRLNSGSGGSLRACPLTWGSAEAESSASAKRYDVVLMSDVIYEVSVRW